MTEALQVQTARATPAPLDAVRAENSQIMQMMQAAAASPDGAATLERLVALKHKMDDRAAALEFAEALREFQTRCPAIERNRTANIKTRGGGEGFAYSYADFTEIMDTVRPHLHALGLSITFDSDVSDKGMLTCRGTLRHVNGHSSTSSFTLPTSSASSMSDQQRYGSALTYAKRQVLISALGLSLADPDAPSERTEHVALTDAQVANLCAALDEIGPDGRARFLKWASIESPSDLPASRLDEAFEAIKAVRERGTRR